jgi:hypothetical protein
LDIKGELMKSQIDCAFSSTCGNDVSSALMPTYPDRAPASGAPSDDPPRSVRVRLGWK